MFRGKYKSNLFSFLIISIRRLISLSKHVYYFIIMTSCRVKIREKIRRERKIDFSSRFHVDARIG